MIDQLVSFVIRPPRAEYTLEEDLIGPTFTIKGRRYRRQDIELVNARGHTLQCSHYGPEVPPNDQPFPCVIYCHGNSGCRADANEAVVMLLPSNITVFALDFSGSGMSGGEYVTLGHYEMQDLATVVDHLRVEGKTSLIGLWGRSMGAVTALLYGATDPSIAGMVLDSPFANLHGLIMELVDVYKIRLPKFGVKLAVQYMRRLIRQKANFDIQELDSLTVAPRTFIPVLFGHAEGDIFIQPHHSHDIHKVYAGDKNIIKFAGDHNSPRPSFYYDSVSIFFLNVLCPPEAAVMPSRGALQTNGVARRSIVQNAGFNDLGIDFDDEEIDQETLYELLGIVSASGGGEEESSDTSQPKTIDRSNSSLGRGRGLRPDLCQEESVKELLDSGTHLPWAWSTSIVPPQGESETEEEKADEVARIMSSSQLRQTSGESFGSDRSNMVFPSSEQDEEKMLLEAINLSLQEHKGASSNGPQMGGGAEQGER